MTCFSRSDLRELIERDVPELAHYAYAEWIWSLVNVAYQNGIENRMSLVGFKANNHPQQTRYAGSNPDVDDRALPPEDFEALQKRFNFSIDVAASADNRKCERFYSIDDDGLSKPWIGERVYCNPPYSTIGPWVEKASMERLADLIVMLLPANRTEQVWWQSWIEPFRDRTGSILTTEFLPGRLRFLKRSQKAIGPNERPPFGCVLAIWNWGTIPANKQQRLNLKGN